MNSVLVKILDLMNKQNISAIKLQCDCGLSNNAVTIWKKRDTFPKDLQKIADYFDVSVDYLLGRTEQMKMPTDFPVTKEEFLSHIINEKRAAKIAALSPEKKEFLFRTIDDTIERLEKL